MDFDGGKKNFFQRTDELGTTLVKFLAKASDSFFQLCAGLWAGRGVRR